MEEDYGAKVLGSFVGSDKYVQKQLDLYLEKLDKVAGMICGHANVQERWLLFSKSFLAKPLPVLCYVKVRLD